MKSLLILLLSGILLVPVAGQNAKKQKTGKQNKNTPVTAPVNQGFQIINEKDSVSYSLGIVMGASIGSAGIKELNDDLFIKGINDAIAGKEMKITAEQANSFLNEYVTKLSNMRANENMVKGQQFLLENSKKDSVVSLPSGLQYKIIKEGNGDSPLDTSMVTVHYTGKLIDGTVFDSSVERGEPAQFPVNGVIPGWTEALKLMKPGSKWVLYIPSDLAYGERQMRTILPNSVLIFDVELISVDK